MLYIRFYYICQVCKEKIFVSCERPLKRGYKVCSKCKLSYKRGLSIKNRLNEDVDFLYIKKLLNQDYCYYCKQYVPLEEREIEHKIPIDRGGHNNNENLCMSCFNCNNQKETMTDKEFFDYLNLTGYYRLEPMYKIRGFALELLSSQKLIEEKVKVDTKVVKVFYDKPVIKNKIIRNQEGKIIGMKKQFIEYEEFEEKTTTIIKTLTEAGRIYNTICKLGNKTGLSTKAVVTKERKLIK